MAASGVGWADGMLREYSEDQTLEVVKLLLDLGLRCQCGQRSRDHCACMARASRARIKWCSSWWITARRLDALDKGEDYGFGVSSVRMTPLNWAEGVPIGMSSAIFHTETVALMARLMKERGIPVVYNSFHGEKGSGYNFGGPDSPK